ncbi:hypothetical protein L596_002863 [Steinernema carpocapsae]|uniref:Uncharacterized protein n=1 Tax=Steinernema carpocapsae TaxID=34508 RepID=A0A4U8USC1_STECR|nr:hypothetical protein L596_002863 [Steinernema carpocapsae]
MRNGGERRYSDSWKFCAEMSGAETPALNRRAQNRHARKCPALERLALKRLALKCPALKCLALGRLALKRLARKCLARKCPITLLVCYFGSTEGVKVDVTYLVDRPCTSVGLRLGNWQA